MEKGKILADKIKGLKEHEVIKPYTLIGTGGVADYFVEVNTVDDLIEAIKVALSLDLPYFVFGEGSKIIFSDFGFPGLVIKNKCQNIALMKEKSQIIADSGTPLSKFITTSASNDLSGLEFLFGLHGTIGGSVYDNIGAHNYSIGDFVKSATLLYPNEKKEAEVIQVDRDWFDFGYRTTKLKSLSGRNKPVILSLRIQLALSKKEDIIKRINTTKSERQNIVPNVLNSIAVFKNPVTAETMIGNVNPTMPSIPKHKTAGYMLDKAGAKKLKVNDAYVWQKHANYVINRGNAKAQEIRDLINKMRELVQNKFGVVLEEDLEYAGQW